MIYLIYHIYKLVLECIIKHKKIKLLRIIYVIKYFKGCLKNILIIFYIKQKWEKSNLIFYQIQEV